MKSTLNFKFFKLGIIFVFIFILFVFNKSNANAEFSNLEPTVDTEVTKDILGSKKNTPVSKQPKIKKKENELITFSARNISIKDAFATLARISGQSISVGSDIRDDETISVIEIQDQPFEEAFYSLIDAAMVNFSSTGNSYTVIKGTATNPVMVFGLGASSVDKSLPVLDRKSDISYDNQDLGTLLKDLANKYGIDIVLTVIPTERVSLRVREVNIEQALQLALSGTSYDYTTAGDGGETFIIYNRLNKNYTLGQESRMYTLMNLEAMDVQALLPAEVRANVRISNDQNSIIADGSVNDLKRIEDFLKEIDKPLPQVELEVKLIEVRRDASVMFNLFPSGGFSVGRLGYIPVKSTSSTSGTTTSSSTSGTTSTSTSPVISDGITSFIPGGFKINLDKNLWNVFNNKITYLESQGKAQIRAYPKLLSLSGRTAMINIDQDTNLVLGSATGQAGSIAVATQQLQRITAGTALSITPIVGTGGLITAKIQIEVSDNSGTTSSNNGVEVPKTTTRRKINADVQVRDGETVAVGGLIVDTNSTDRVGLPFLTRIPYLKNFASNKSKTAQKSELIVLITPTIRNIPEEQSELQETTEENPAGEKFVESANNE